MRVTTVWITPKGNRYHQGPRCPSFEDAELKNGFPIRAFPSELAQLRTSGRELTRCSVCWGVDEWLNLFHQIEIQGGTAYEVMFARVVLKAIPALRPSAIRPQVPVEGASGQGYRADFVVSAGEGDRLIVEINGDDKDPQALGFNATQEAIERKTADLSSNGWEVLNFRNVLVANDPDTCRQLLEARLHVHAPLNKDLPTAPPRGSRPSAGAADSKREPTGTRKRWLVGGAASLLIAGAVWLSFVQLTDGGDGTGVEPRGRECPASADIKGNINDSGERIFHEPGWRYYDVTVPEVCFESSGDAEADGFRESEVQ